MDKESNPISAVKSINLNESDKSFETSEKIDSETNVAIATKGGREISNKILHISSLHKSIEEDQLHEIFSKFGPIKLAKVLNDKNKVGFNYAFVEFLKPENASEALKCLNNTEISKTPIVIKWAYNSSNANSVQSTEPVYNIFVGDLSPEVDDESLRKAFGSFKSVREAHVMWDMQTSRSRGYGFVTFLDQQEAHIALNTMNGHILLGRAIRCNWAAHKLSQNQNNLRRTRKNGGNVINQSVPPFVHQLGNQLAISGYENQLQPQTPIHRFSQPPLLSENHQSSMSSPGPGNPPPYSISQAHAQSIQNSPLRTPASLKSPTSTASSSTTSNSISQQHANSSLEDCATNGPPPFQVLNNEMQHQFENYDLSETNPNIIPSQSFELVLRQSPNWQTTVYLGNIAHFTTQNELIPLVQHFGFLVDFKFHPDKGCAFAKFDTHERAALAIVQLAGFNVNGRPLKCGWGRDRPSQFRNVPQGFHQRS